MTTTLLIITAVVLLAGLVYACHQIEGLRKGLATEHENHKRCHDAAEDIVLLYSNRLAAAALRDAANRYDAIENQAELQRIGRTLYAVGGPSVPVYWLREQADLLDPPERA